MTQRMAQHRHCMHACVRVRCSIAASPSEPWPRVPLSSGMSVGVLAARLRATQSASPAAHTHCSYSSLWNPGVSLGGRKYQLASSAPCVGGGNDMRQSVTSIILFLYVVLAAALNAYPSAHESVRCEVQQAGANRDVSVHQDPLDAVRCARSRQTSQP